ncbi:hypothetical protein N657DRAFT_675119 [Parathielavia appendiculata]|uniref:Uncharacterized protein n=1 Tax=Parathielavia appendiculata TaxID=2587402 RepID=A0AAN6YYQ9_9PEZI|nr:hypothetical protein N657DRAFT_675119 [Parathielavia appendiculata]
MPAGLSASKDHVQASIGPKDLYLLVALMYAAASLISLMTMTSIHGCSTALAPLARTDPAGRPGFTLKLVLGLAKPLGQEKKPWQGAADHAKEPASAPCAGKSLNAETIGEAIYHPQTSSPCLHIEASKSKVNWCREANNESLEDPSKTAREGSEPKAQTWSERQSTDAHPMHLQHPEAIAGIQGRPIVFEPCRSLTCTGREVVYKLPLIGESIPSAVYHGLLDVKPDRPWPFWI